MQIHHVGYLVKNIEKAKVKFEKLGFVVEGETVFDKYRGIDILFMINDGYRIELVSPKTSESVVADTYKKLGNSPYHICYYCDCIESAMDDLRKDGYLPLGEPSPAVAIDGKKVCFLFNRQIGILELVEQRRPAMKSQA